MTSWCASPARARPRAIPAACRTTSRKAIAHELKIIKELRYEAYFLTVWDIVRFARSQGILCQGRGSAANSAVCFCLGITEVDPKRGDLLFERFISPERNEPPDIDVDFEHERREEVIQYIYEKYGREHAGIAATVITYRSRSAAREVGKAFGLSEDAVGALAGNIWGWSSDGLNGSDARRAGLDPDERRIAQVLELSREIIGFPRHLSQHVGGFVITRSRLDEVVPILHSAMDGRDIIEWDKDDLDALKMLKIDVLALGMLTAMKRALDLLETHYGKQLTLASIPAEDPQVYDMICRADTIGVFQIESRAQMTMLPRLRPRNYYDLVIEVAIVRPGPIQGDMVHPYLRRRQGLETVAYPKPFARAWAARRAGTGARQDARRAALPGAGHADRHRGGKIHARRGRPPAPRHGDLPPRRHHPHLRGEDDRGHGRARLRARFRRALLPPDRGLWRIRLPRKPCRQLRPSRLHLRLGEMPLPGRLLRRAAERPAHGLLRAGPDSCATHASTAWRCAKSTSIFREWDCTLEARH